MKIAFCGPSGSGKTTLAQFIADEFKLQYLRGSAGYILPDEDKEVLTKLGYEFTGHHEVIQKCSNPDFAYNFENMVRHRRKELILSNDNFITDRSPVDNMVYFLTQTSYHMTDFNVVGFKQECQAALNGLTHLIYIRCVNESRQIENNNSRIPNFHYQRMIDAVFTHALSEYFVESFLPNGVKFLSLDVWDLEKRKQLVKEFLTPNGQGKG